MMESSVADETLQEILGRSDFVGGIDNEALDFSQLEDFINDESDASNTYFADTLAHNEAPRAPHATPVVVVGPPSAPPLGPDGGGSPCHVTKPPQQGYQHPHNLPESPPDSGSEPPYSPQDPASHSPHGTTVPVHPELLLHPHLYPPSHLKPVINAPGENLLNHQPVLTPLLTQRSAQSIQQCLTQPPPGQTLQNIGLVPNSNTLVLAAAHAGLAAVSDCQSGGITTLYSSLQGGAKKRKLSQDNGQPVVQVKQEPGGELSPDSSSNQTGGVADDDYGFEIPGESGLYLDSSYQCIRFQQFQPASWHALCDQHLKELPVPHYRVDADKGFNFSNADDAFVCQKKNHFQITCHAQLQGDAQFVKTPDGLQKVASFHLHFYGVKVESPTQTIKVEQSQSDRSKKPFHPVLVDLAGEQVTKVTVGRLHFSETTSNNMRKKGKPNPDQRYFYLVVGLHAHCADASHYPIVSHASERIIVRASNPGQFESDVELCWQKGHTPESVFHAGRVGINTDRPDEALVVHGNLKVTGHIVQPSDHRAKSEILECDSREQLRNVQQLRVVRYRFAPEFALHSGLDTLGEMETGLIAQQVQQVIPDAVRPAGDIVLPSGRRIDNFLVVNKDRIFMENVGAVKELCKVTDNLETRIDELERMNKKLAGLKRFDSLKSTNSSYGGSVSSKMSGSAVRTKDGGRHRRNEDFCSNKLIQITVVILVLIMAFCLVAMATLYFLEFQKRNRQDIDFISYSQHVGHSRSHHVPTESSYASDPPDRSPSNDSRPAGSPTKNANRSPHSNVITHPGWSPWKPVPSVTQGPRERTNAAATERTESPAGGEDSEPLVRGTSPPVLGRPKTCVHVTGGHYLDAEEHACPTFCCPNDLPHLEDSPDQHPDPAGQTNTVSRSARHYSHPSNGGTHAGNALEEGKRPHALKGGRRRRGRRDADDWSDSDNVYTNMDAATDTDQTGVFVSVRGEAFNRSIGGEFCWNAGLEYGRCVERTAYNYSYGVPLSKYLPDETLVINFHFSRSVMWAEACPPLQSSGDCAALRSRPPEAQTGPEWEEQPVTESQAEWEEPKVKALRPNPIVGTEWEVAPRQPPGDGGDWEGPGDHGSMFSVEVGSLSRSPVRYRVPLVQSVNNICSLPSTKLGVEFLEYNFLFYRDCDE